MKKLPLFFCLLLLACSSQKQTVTDLTDINSHPKPYRIYSVGKWNAAYQVLTLTDANDKYFTVKTNYNPSLKKGEIYQP